ncbi:MAG: PH domain-containing protein [Spirochaetales bacterium]|nr:PH domain-containing protein [Spirochaetales bacterium]
MDKKFLEDRLRELGIYSEYYHRLELKPLATYLPYDEKVNCILTGYYSGSRRMVAVTDSRIVVIAAGPMVQTQIMVIKRKAVKSWRFNRKILLSSVEIVTDDGTFTFSQTQGGREKLFNWAMEQPIREYDE